jgi:outer membrane receptor protein involved in Fe transport
MRKVTSYLVAFVLANFFVVAAFAQNAVISGNVKNSATGENAAAVSVTIKGSDLGTYTDDKGNFTITAKSVPVTLVFTSVGYESQEVSVSSAGEKLNVSFIPSNSLGQEVVVSASRVPEKIMESPVSIERVNATAIRNAPAASFYDVVTNLKGVDVTTSSLTFKTPTTRGFGGSGNVRFNQLVDGMDNQAPGLNFSVGAIVGLNELDVDNIELLSGASSALYGPGGMNGTLLMTSKSPFKYQGLSFVAKTGIMHTDGSERPASPYYNWALRWGKKISEKFAFKVTTELVHAKDWIGMDYRNFDRLNNKMVPGNRQTDPNYDGVNVFGDETSIDLRSGLEGLAANPPLPAIGQYVASYLANNPGAFRVSRTGYTEQELMNPNTINYKIGGALHYKLSTNTEAVISGHWGTGNTIYTGASRYSIQGFKMGQYKVELNNKNWMLRAYTTQENAGGTYNLAATTQNFNESWKPSTVWYPQYLQAFVGAKMSGATDTEAHNAARAIADVGRPKVGTAQFNDAYDKVRRLPVPKGGALLDRTDLYSIEGSYNLSSITKSFADVLVGANYKRYALNSQGTLFADSTGPISIKEFGAFVQASRDITDMIKIQASGRYDKNENFEGRFTPRVTALVKVAPNNNIRLSYQTAYRFPSTQQQWINLDLSSYKLIGGNEDFVQHYQFDTNPAYFLDNYSQGQAAQWNYPQQKPESLTSFELGYKGLLMESKLLIDMYGYYGNYTDFTGRTRVVQSKSGAPILTATDLQIYSVPINYPDKIKTYGFGIGLDYRLPKNFMAGLNVASDNLDVPANIIASFNSPKYKLNASLGNTGFGKGNRLGFNMVYRWQDEFYYEGDLASGDLPAVHTLDAQVSYKMPKTKSIFKVGANNLLNQYYYNAIGNSRIGGLYYVSFGFNVY